MWEATQGIATIPIFDLSLCPTHSSDSYHLSVCSFHTESLTVWRNCPLQCSRPTERAEPCCSFTNTEGLSHFSWTDAQKGWVEDTSGLYPEARPVRTEMAPLQSARDAARGAICLHPSVYCLVGQLGQLFMGNRDSTTYHSCHCWASESYFTHKWPPFLDWGHRVSGWRRRPCKWAVEPQSPCCWPRSTPPSPEKLARNQLPPPQLSCPEWLGLGWGLHSFSSYLKCLGTGSTCSPLRLHTRSLTLKYAQPPLIKSHIWKTSR